MIPNIITTNFTGSNIPLSKLKQEKDDPTSNKLQERHDRHTRLQYNSQLYRTHFFPLNLYKKKASSNADAVNYLKNNFNIEADFGNNTKLASLVVKAFRNVNNILHGSLENTELKIVSDYSVFKNRPKGKYPDGTVKETEPALLITAGNKSTLCFNPDCDWDNVEQRVQDNFEKGNLAYKEPIGLVYHEIGHFLHHNSNLEKYNAANDESPYDTDKIIIEKQVSKLATKDFGELVAEVFAKKMLKHYISDEVQDLYKDWAHYGPNIF